MDPPLYYKTFRPYIRFFEDVVYEGVERTPLSYRGETGAQSSIMPTLVAFMKIPHQPIDAHRSSGRHAALHAGRAPRGASRRSQRCPTRGRSPSQRAVQRCAGGDGDQFREVHFGWADEYIHQRVTDPRGTGGTPYRQWLQQLIDETRNHMK